MGHDLTIYNRNGEKKFNLLSRSNVSTVTRATQKQSLLADDTITISAESARPLDLTIGDYIMIFGKRYKFNQLPQPAKNGDRRFSYEMTLEGPQYDLIDAHCHLPANAYGETYYANLPKHLEVLIWNVNRIHPGWTVETEAGCYDPDNYQNITTSEKNALAMLQELCSLFSVEFEITANGAAGVIHIRKKAGATHDFTLRYGRGRGLYQLARANVNNAGITNRLYVYGSQENLPQNYGHNKLCLAGTTRLTSYIEDAASIEAYGVKEGEKNYPDTKPERIGRITALGPDRITFMDASGSETDPDNPPMFDLNEKDADGNTKWLIEGANAKISFQTGNLAGYEFDLHSYDHAANKFVINRFTDENGLVIPNDEQDAFSFAVGDKYIITDIRLPEAYVSKAQAKLDAAARADFPTMTQPQVSYKLGLAEDFCKAFFGSGTATEVLRVGDFIHIIDEEIGVDKEVRIIAITRDLLRAHSYELTLSDTVTKSSIVKVLNDISDIQDAISYNTGFTNPGKARRRWLATQELLSMVFDPEGDYYSEKIKPLSIETRMLSVGAKSTQFTLNNVTIQPNLGGDPNAIQFSSGLLVHYGIDTDNPKTWTMTTMTTGGLSPMTPYYIYARCPRSAGSGAWRLSLNPIPCESEAAFYNFLVGVLNSVSTDLHGGSPARLISLTYGSSTVNGRFVRCGRIESSGGGATYFDLDTGVISGRILFRGSDGTIADVASLEDKTKELEDYINNTLPTTIDGISTQLDGKIETWFQEEDPSCGWTPDEDPAHIGDLWFNTATKELKRYSASFLWERIEDADAIAAAEAASHAQDTADGKRRVFVETPATPYDKGDMWAQGSTGDLMRCIRSRAAGPFQSSDWDRASKYTGDENLNDFIVNTYNVAMEGLTSQLDGVIETHFGSGVPTLTNAPAKDWATTNDREAHLGDLYYDNETGIGYRFSKDGDAYAWIEVRDTGVIEALAAAAAAQDTADGKRRVFIDTPYPPYDPGDLWAQGGTGDLLVCATGRASGYFDASDWVRATNYTDDSALTNFIINQYTGDMAGLFDQIDGKIECFYTSTNPADSWQRTEYEAHIGDQWYDTANKKLYRWASSGWVYLGNSWRPPLIPDGVGAVQDSISHKTYYWSRIQDADAIAAAAAAAEAQDTADGKRTVFTAEPKGPYFIGDLWLKNVDSSGKASGGLWRAIKDNPVKDAFDANDWCEAVYYDCTQTSIDGGIVTAGTVQLANEFTSSIVAGITGGWGKTLKETATTPEDQKVRIWAGASEGNRTTAPFRVLQNGKMFATDAEIKGKVTATEGSFTGAVNANSGRIGRLIILGNDLAGVDDNGVERVRIGVGALPSINTAFSRVGIPFALFSSDGMASYPEDAGGYYTANVIGESREISIYPDGGGYTNTASVAAKVMFTLDKAATKVTFGRWDADYTTSSSSQGEITIDGTAKLYRVDGSARTLLKVWAVEQQSPDITYNSLSAGSYEVDVSIRLDFSGQFWYGSVEFWIGGGIWIETASQSTNLTSMAKDGILTMHSADKYLFYSATKGFETRYGNYGLKVDSTGAKVLVNGQWKTIMTT